MFDKDWRHENNAGLVVSNQCDKIWTQFAARVDVSAPLCSEGRVT